jgi:hypothetical protein
MNVLAMPMVASVHSSDARSLATTRQTTAQLKPQSTTGQRACRKPHVYTAVNRLSVVQRAMYSTKGARGPMLRRWRVRNRLRKRFGSMVPVAEQGTDRRALQGIRIRRDPPKIIAHHPILLKRPLYPQHPHDCNHGGNADHASEDDHHDVEIIAWNLPSGRTRVCARAARDRQAGALRRWGAPLTIGWEEFFGSPNDFISPPAS